MFGVNLSDTQILASIYHNRIQRKQIQDTSQRSLPESHHSPRDCLAKKVVNELRRSLRISG